MDRRRSEARAEERGAALLLALVLCVVLTSLGLSVLAARDSSTRVRSAVTARDRAARLAASGLEWAAAWVMDRGSVATTVTLALGTNRQVRVQVQPASTPQALAEGTCQGAVVRVAANLESKQGAPLPFAYASFDMSNRFEDPVTVKGSAWFEEPFSPITASSGGRLEMHGDLYLRTSSAPASGSVLQVSGATRYSQPALGAPATDVSPFASMTSGAVPVVHYSGTTTIRDRTITGVVDVALGLLDRLTIENVTIQGTLVVRRTGLLSSLSYPPVELRGNVNITGGTATTGNLAILAPLCELRGNS